MTPPSFSLVSINIERSKHLDTVIPFLEKHTADVVTLQEVMERDIPLLERAAGKLVAYTPICLFLARPPEEEEGLYGQAIFSPHEVVSAKHIYYGGDHDPLWRFAEDTEEEIAHIARALTSARLRVRGEVLDIATTHFTWSVEGLVTPTQTKDLDSLLTLLCDMPEFILTGDFNAPRGRKTFDTLAQRYKDNIPSQYKTSIDIALHRAGKTRGHELVDKMVDGLFTTPAYRVHDVVLHTGVSDHMGITARITKL